MLFYLSINHSMQLNYQQAGLPIGMYIPHDARCSSWLWAHSLMTFYNVYHTENKSLLLPKFTQNSQIQVVYSSLVVVVLCHCLVWQRTLPVARLVHSTNI